MKKKKKLKYYYFGRSTKKCYLKERRTTLYIHMCQTYVINLYQKRLYHYSKSPLQAWHVYLIVQAWKSP